MSETYVARSAAVAARLLGGETVVMCAADSTLFSLSEVATVIWQAADGRTPLSEIARRICAEYDVAAETALQDAEAFATELARYGILRVSDQPISSAESGATGSVAIP